VTDGLRLRVTGEASRSLLFDPGQRAGAISLLGVVSLIGLEPPMVPDLFCEPSNIEAVLEHNDPDRPDGAFGYIQVQTWLGLRTIARTGSIPVRVPSDVGKRSLAHWRRIESHTPKQGLLNSWMVDWLEKCECENWLLIRDPGCRPESATPQ
jgi:hypothetical protein